MTRYLLPAALALFIAGGLLTGTIGLRSLASLPTSAPSPTPVPTAAPVRVLPPTTTSSTSARPTSNVAPQAEPTQSRPPKPVPSWLFVANGNLWEIGGGDPVQLTSQGNVSQPALGADRLVFVSRSRNGSDLWQASADGPPQPITHDLASSPDQSHWASQPVFLPDRSRMYVLGDFNKSSTGAGDLAIWELGFGKEAPVQITTPQAYAGGDQDITVNPEDPGQIVFTRYEYAGAQLVEELEWLNVPDSIPVALTQPDQSARQASFATDGKTLAFVQHDATNQENLYVADIGPSSAQAGPQLEDPRQVASGVIANPIWTPDGSMLAYLALTDNGFQLFAMDIQLAADGTQTFGDPRQITRGSGLDATSRPVWLSADQAEQVRQWLPPLAP